MQIIEASPKQYANAAAFEPLMDSEEAARILGIAPATVRKMCGRGTFKAVKIGRAWKINRAAFYEQMGIDA